MLRGFLGIVGYYIWFIKNFASTASALIYLLQKDSFVWTKKAQQAFDNLKQHMANPPILTVLDFSKPFVIETDASGTDIGAILNQNNRPNAFYNKKLNTKMQMAST